MVYGNLVIKERHTNKKVKQYVMIWLTALLDFIVFQKKFRLNRIWKKTAAAMNRKLIMQNVMQ